MKAPDKIYVNIPGDYWYPGTDEKVNMDTEYIRKDAILEWANNWEKIGVSDDFAYAIQTLIKHIEQL